MSIGSFKSRSRAERLVAEAVRATGLSFSVLRDEESGLYRVANGPHRSKSDARQTLAAIRSRELEGWIFSRPADTPAASVSAAH